MIEKMTSVHPIARSAVFITGLSAGGAMANAMLAVYPDMFAAGAVIAGLPFGAASDVHGALQSMSAASDKPAAHWGDQVRNASRNSGPWPRISVWHGRADETVDASNARETVKQWVDVNGLSNRSETCEEHKTYRRRVWCNHRGEPTVERYDIAGMRHGIALGRTQEGMGHGRVGQYFLDVGLSSSQLIAGFWGLCGASA
jgi:feruloyl esterase